ncbi:MAG TPA: NAD-dependent epimerase/dehydratase family protein, partial [Pseudonocardia sp.]|nr:NAD-dependent epimerase/dehydratase family protein [Pseudonocardia sp.]
RGRAASGAHVLGGGLLAQARRSPVDEGWPTGGVTSSPYSRHKVAAERLLDDHQRSHPTTIARLRPGIIGQGAAGSALLRYGVPAAIPAAVLGHIPVLPLDRRLEVPMVHADDVADAIVRVLDRQAAGAFNLAADPPVTVAHIARALGARHVQVPFRVLRGAASLSWHARLQQVDPGWVDLGYTVPLLDTSRAREELGWSPSVGGVEVLEETLAGMRHRSARRTPVLRPRTVPDMLARALRRGPVSERHEP